MKEPWPLGAGSGWTRQTSSPASGPEGWRPGGSKRRGRCSTAASHTRSGAAPGRTLFRFSELPFPFPAELEFPLSSWWKVGTLLTWGRTHCARAPGPGMTKVQRFLGDCVGTQRSGTRVVTWSGRVCWRRLHSKALSLLLVLFSGELSAVALKVPWAVSQERPYSADLRWYIRRALSLVSRN
jgi:hypothetical protein